MLPPLKSLQAFEAAARIGSFTLAAEELNVSQSAISHQIRNLEDFFGLQLFAREGASFTLTPEGARLYGGLSEAMTLIKRSVADLKSAQKGLPVGLSIRPHFAMKWLAPRLVEFWRHHPGFDLRFQHSDRPADFSDPALHVSIEWCHESAVSDHARLLLAGDLTPACHPDLRLGQPGDLTHHILLHESDETSWAEWLALAGVPGLSATRKEFYEDTNVRQQAAIEGEGVALVCPPLVADDLAARRLVLPFDLKLKSYAYYLVAPPDRLANPKVKRFVDWLLSDHELDS